MNLGVYIPTYSCGQYIGETIESVLSQSIPSIKVVVVDNFSSDETENVVKQYLSSGVQYIKQKSNIGVVNNFNYCLDVADTDYIKLLSADDVLLPGILSRQMNALRDNKDCGIATCNYLVTDSTLKVISRVNNLPGKVRGDDAVSICAAKVANLIGNPSAIMFRRTSLDMLRFDSKFKWYGDFRFSCNILRNSNLINVDVDGLLYRRHDFTDSNVACSAAIRLSDEIGFVNEFARHRAEPHLRLLKRYKAAYVAHVFSRALSKGHD